MSTTDMEKKLKRKRVCSAIYGVISTLIVEAIVVYVQYQKYPAFNELNFEVWLWPVIWLGHSILYFIFDQICYPTKSQRQYFKGMCIVLICIWGYLGMWVLCSFVVAPLVNEVSALYSSHVVWGMVLLISHYILERKKISKKAAMKNGEGEAISNVQSKIGEYWGRTMRIKIIALVIITLITLLLQLIYYYRDAYMYIYIPSSYREFMSW